MSLVDRRTFGPGRCLVLSLILLSSLALSSMSGADADPGPGGEDVVLLTLGDREYSAKVDLDEKARFAWVLENRNESRSFDVTVQAEAAGGKWDVTVDQKGFTLGPGSARLVEVSVSSSKGDDGDSTSVHLSITLVELGVGNISYLNATAIVKLDHGFKGGLDILLWHIDLPSQVDNPFGQFFILLVIWSVVVYLLIVAIIDGVLRWAVRETKTEADDIVLDIVRRPAIGLSIAYGVVDTLKVLDIPREWISEIYKWFTVIAIAVCAYILYKILKNVLVYYGDLYAKRTGSEAAKMMVPLINNLVSVVIVMVAVSFILSFLGFDITMAVAGLGIMGLVIAFAAQDTLSNFFSGIHMLIDRPFQRGDLIILESGEMCEIRDIGFRSVRLHDVTEHVLITMPNNKLANAKIVNISAPDFNYRLKLEVPVAYESDIELVKRTLLEVVRTCPDVLNEGKFRPTVRFKSFGDSQLDIELFVWINDIRKDNFLIINRLRSELNERIDSEFRKKGIKVPFPQREIWVSSMPPKGPGV